MAARTGKWKEQRGGTAGPITPRQKVLALPAALVLFWVICYAVSPLVKPTALVLTAAAVVLGAVRFRTLQRRVTPVLIALVLMMILGGISTFYAVSGKFALSEFLKILAAVCVTLILLSAAPGSGEETSRWIAAVLEAAAAVSGLVSIDLLSTRVVSTVVLAPVSLAVGGYADLGGLEAGVRMTSVFGNPNYFAGIVGMGTLLALGSVQSAEDTRERLVHTACLYINALAFVLAFSMGASITIAVAFAAYLILEHRQRRGSLFILMLETLVLTVAAAGVISATSFTTWTGPRMAPLLCTVLGAAALAVLDRFAGSRLAEKWKDCGGKVLIFAAAAVVVLLAGAAAACSITGAADLGAKATLRRAAYPAPGAYTLAAPNSAEAQVTIESQNQQDTMMHTSTVLYKGPADGAAFTVPEDSLVVYFNFRAGKAGRIDSASYAGPENGRIPLHYKFLPGFIANRLQGLFANQNAIQRTVFFADGMKLFKQSPVIGLGLGTFECAQKSVQSFYYETKYVHNHYIQCLMDMGVLGLLLFLGLLAVSGVTLWRAWRKENAPALVPALAAILIFMAGHAAVEVNFSTCAYLPFAYGCFALMGLSGGDMGLFPLSEKIRGRVRMGALLVLGVFLVIFAVLLWGNMRARKLVEQDPTLDSFVEAIQMDKFEWTDYMLSYVVSTMGPTDDRTRQRADAYAQRLAELDSNTTHYYLAEYYMVTDREELALKMLEKHVRYMASDKEAWQQTFTLLQFCAVDEPYYREGVAALASLREQWERENMGSIELTEEAEEFIMRMTGGD